MLKFPFIGGKKTTAVNDNLAETMPMLFYKEVNGHVEHGSVYITHAGFKLKNFPISFGFQDLVIAPEMTPEILTHIWDMAERQGFIVHGLRSYATVFPVQPTPHLTQQGIDRPPRTGISRPIRRPTGDRTRP